MVKVFTIRRKGQRRTTPSERLRIPVWGVSVVACSTALVAVLATLLATGTNVGVWLSEFFQSSGLAGLCALGAALLAFIGIRRQVAVSLRGLAHQREVDQTRAWWDRFEWVAGRAVPKSEDETKLPYDAILSTLASLAETAEESVQENAVGAIMEAAARAEGKNIRKARPGGYDLANRAKALQDYSELTRNSLASSNSVNEQLYAIRLGEALQRIVATGSLEFEPSLSSGPEGKKIRPDIVVKNGGKVIVIEIKLNLPGGAHQIRSFDSMVRRTRRAGADRVIVVSPNNAVSELADEIDANFVTWESAKDDYRLLEAINGAKS